MPATPAWPPKSLPRLFVRSPLSEGAQVGLDVSQANYLGNVLRLGESAQVLLFDNRSGEWLAHIAQAGRKRMTLSVERLTREPERVPDVWLAFAPIKRAQTDWLVEKATELGVARLVPVITQRTVVERVPGPSKRTTLRASTLLTYTLPLVGFTAMLDSVVPTPEVRPTTVGTVPVVPIVKTS